MLAAFLLLQAAPDMAPPDTATDVVLIGHRLEDRWAAKFRSDRNGLHCQVTRSTGDAEIDRVGCAAMEACLPTFESRYAATDDRAIRPDVKKLMRASLNQERDTCVKRERQTGIAALVARRKGA